MSHFQLTPVEMVLFALAVVASVYFGYQGFKKVFLVIKRGQGEFPAKEIPKRLWRAAVEWAGLLPTWRARRGVSLMHAFIAWAFIFYFLVNALDVLRGYTGWTVPGTVGGVYRLIADVLSVAALVAMTYFLLRRFVFKTPAFNYRENVKLMPQVNQGRIRRDSLIVGLFILFHIGFRFLGESFDVAREYAAAGHRDPWQPFASAVSGLWGGMSEPALNVAQHVSWWIALGLILAFIPYFPYTKHIHLIMSGLNFLLRPQRTSLGELEPIDMEDESIEQFGVARLEHLPWKHILDAYACIMCNRCQDVCPAYLTGKELSPSALEVNKRLYINANINKIASGGETEPLLDYAISESAVWACTACGACIHVCPVGNEPMFDILYMRRNQMMMENAFPHELQAAYRGMERSGNPWNLARRDRMAWAADLDIPTVEDNPDFEILWWVGCAPSYDARAQSTARAFAQVLKAAGVSFAVLGEMENCTGDSARRSGNEALFFELAKANIEVLNEFVGGDQPKRIVTTCPHCMHALGKEYHQYGGRYTVIHSTQLLAELMEQGKLQPKALADGQITFHDPCYLGRHNGVVEAPRLALAALADGRFVEMPRHGVQSFCCGAGGAQMWKEEEHGDKPVNVARYEEAAATGAKTIAVSCPFCLTMLTDASKRADQGIVVKDVVELVAEAL
ncbi:MAG: (Fe-S)-binding protein [Caldilineales bacterium]|nr:(Fe-S)-binding protein [Caldilineales bacterium]MDW8316811.1 (Fe-S)-binding protein [Anaerolineae bacterium]